MATEVLPNALPRLEHDDVLGPDSSDDEPLVPVRKKAKPVKRERSATATVEPDTKKAMHVKRERSASAPAEPEPGSLAPPPNSPGIANDVPKDPRLIDACVAEQTKFTPEKPNFTITRVDDQFDDSSSDNNSYADVEESQAV